MHKILLALLLSFPVHAALNDVDKAQVLHQNMLSNPGFENGLVGWTASGGAVVLITSGSNLLKGKRSVTWDASAAAQTYCSALVPVEEGDKGENGLSMIKIKTPSGTATHTLFANDGSNPVGPAVTVTSDANGVITQVNFIYPTSGSVQLCIEAQADEPLIAIDLGYQGFAANITSVTPNSTAQSYTPDIAGFGTETAVTFTWSQDGIYMDVTGTFTGATVESSEAQIALPNGYTIASQVSGLTNAGSYARSAAAVDKGGLILMTAGDAFVNMSSSSVFGSSSANAVAAVNGDAIAGNSQLIIVQFRVPIAEFAASVSVFKADQTNRPWTSYTPTFTGFGVVTNISCEEKRQGEDMLIRCRATAGTPDGAEARASLARSKVSKSTISTLEIAGKWIRNASSTAKGGLTFNEASVGYITFSSREVFGSGTTIGLNKATGGGTVTAGDTFSFTARIPIEGWNETMNAPHVKFSVVTSDTQVQATESAEIDCDASSSILSEDGSWLTSVANVSSGACAITIDSGIFSAAPKCWLTFSDALPGGTAILMPTIDSALVTTTNVTVDCKVDSGSDCNDYDFNLFCKGPR